MDLKEYNPTTQGGSTSNRGLGLPRVKLEDLNKLEPAINNPTDEEKKAHTGLLVFNVNNVDPLKSGIYVWTGTEWIPIIGGSDFWKSLVGDTGIYYDQSVVIGGVHIYLKRLLILMLQIKEYLFPMWL